MKKMLFLTTLLLSFGCDKFINKARQLALSDGEAPALGSVEKEKLNSLLEQEHVYLGGDKELDPRLKIIPSWEYDQEADRDLKSGRNPASEDSQNSFYIKLKYIAPHDDVVRTADKFYSGFGTHHQALQRQISEEGYEKYCKTLDEVNGCLEFGQRKKKNFEKIKSKIQEKMRVIGIYGKGETFKVVYRKLELGPDRMANHEAQVRLRKPASLAD